MRIQRRRVQAELSSDLARTGFQVLALGGLVAASMWIVLPFIPALLWAAAITVATWPLLLHMEAALKGSRALAVAAMTMVLVVLLVVPFYLVISTIAGNVNLADTWSRSLKTFTLPPLPNWLGGLPLIGGKLTSQWRELAAAGPEVLRNTLAPFTRQILLWFLKQAGNLGLLLLDFIVTVIFCGLFYAHGESLAHDTIILARRLAGAEGEKVVRLAALAVRGVALGIVVAAILQAVLAGLGLLIGGVPFAALLTALMFVLAVAQIGPGPVLIPAVVWVYFESGGVWGTSLLVWAVFCMTFDSFLRPALIKRSADIPLILIFIGVVGGLLALGAIGIFVGPVVLAVAHTLFRDWMTPDEVASENYSAEV